MEQKIWPSSQVNASECAAGYVIESEKEGSFLTRELWYKGKKRPEDAFVHPPVIFNYMASVIRHPSPRGLKMKRAFPAIYRRGKGVEITGKPFNIEMGAGGSFFLSGEE
jgi:hypothetical protein